MNTENWRTYYAGLGIYGVCIALAALPIFSTGISLRAVLALTAAALLASVIVALFRTSHLCDRLDDPVGAFVQAFLGIVVCSGLYCLLGVQARPEIMFMVFLLWTAVGLLHLTPLRVLVLFAINTVIYLGEFSGNLFIAAGGAQHQETVFMLVAAAVLTGFMGWRAWEYTRVRREKARLRDENARQAAEIEDAKERIHKLTVQDMDTIALKYPFFKEELRRCKQKADAQGHTFTVGLIAIDHFDALKQQHGDGIVKQLLREVVDRSGKVIAKLSLDERGDDSYHPLGRVGDGLFGMILPRTNLKGAQVCAQLLHKTVEFQAIRTMAGMVNVTLTVGLAEYFPGESIDALMEMVGRALEKARLKDAQTLQALNRPIAPKAPPVRAARSTNELRLLHVKEYDSPVH